MLFWERMVGIELIGIGLVLVSIIYSFYKKNENLSLKFVVILFVLLYLWYGIK